MFLEVNVAISAALTALFVILMFLSSNGPSLGDFIITLLGAFLILFLFLVPVTMWIFMVCWKVICDAVGFDPRKNRSMLYSPKAIFVLYPATAIATIIASFAFFYVFGHFVEIIGPGDRESCWGRWGCF